MKLGEFYTRTRILLSHIKYNQPYNVEQLDLLLDECMNREVELENRVENMRWFKKEKEKRKNHDGARYNLR